ncbi:MAG: HAD hydrolase-like protein, partial [candidate division NC10 bacterium]
MDAMREVLRPYGIAYTDSENEEFFGFTDPEVFRVLRARYGLEPDDHALTRRRAALLVELTRKRTVPMPGVPDVPTALHRLGYRLAVASSSALDVIHATVDVLGIAALFETLVSGLEVGRGNPAPDLFVETPRPLRLEESARGLAEFRHGTIPQRRVRADRADRDELDALLGTDIRAPAAQDAFRAHLGVLVERRVDPAPQAARPLQPGRALGEALLDFGDADIALDRDNPVILAVPPVVAGSLVPQLRVPTEFRAIVNA